ncbi:MAG: FliM/FliN family flagellar motor switch protein [Phycisphaerae bacterium]|jgi:flagellar motor switch protein FliN/FliY|nr:FliM/FliN family flagellar motor switch protein [Phycisphaerae bacterium]
MAETTQAVEEKIEEQQAQQNQSAQENPKAQAQSVEYSQAPEGKTTPGTSIDILLDMEVPVAVVIGQIEIPIQKFLQLGQGSVLKLDKPIEAPADLYLKDTRFATGNIVVVEDKFAVRIKEILSAGTAAAAAANKE